MSEKLVALLKVISDLRNPETGCPWDRKQTHQSLKKYLVEETYETLDAIDVGPDELSEELGDLLLQILLHCQIASEQGHFSFENVCEGLHKKLISRHPHVFGDSSASTPEEVAKLWEARKKEESPQKGLLEGVPKNMPALLRAQRMSEKAARIGFEWPTLQGIREQILDEVREFVEASETLDIQETFDEFGDVLFSLVQLARRLNFEAEDALQGSNAKFLCRFSRMESLSNSTLDKLSLDEMQDLWAKVKAEEKTET
jgi:MazG family protein